MQIPPDALGLLVAVATLIGSAFAVKFLVWGKGPILRASRRPDDGERSEALDERVGELLAVVREQADRLEDLSERLDFTERMLSRGWPEAAPASPEPVASPPRMSAEEST